LETPPWILCFSFRWSWSGSGWWESDTAIITKAICSIVQDWRYVDVQLSMSSFLSFSVVTKYLS
jgi:hypothetical protein